MEQYYSTLHNLKQANENHLKVIYLISIYLFLYSHLAYVQGVERDFLTFNADSTLQQSLSCNESRCCSWIENFLTFNTANGSSFGDISIGSNELFPSIKLNNDTISLKFINGAGIAFGYHQPISSRIFGRGKTRQGISGDKLFRSSLNSSYSQPTNGPSENLTGQQNNGQLPVQSEAYSGNSFVINPLITTQINNSRLNTIYHRKASNGGLDLLPTSKEFAIRVYNHLHNRPLIAIGNTRTGGIRWLTNTTVFGFRGVRLNVQNSANKAHYVGNVVSIVKVGLPCGHNYIRFGQRFFGDSNKIGIPTPLESVVTQPEVQGLKESSLINAVTNNAKGNYVLIGLVSKVSGYRTWVRTSQGGFTNRTLTTTNSLGDFIGTDVTQASSDAATAIMSCSSENKLTSQFEFRNCAIKPPTTPITLRTCTGQPLPGLPLAVTTTSANINEAVSQLQALTALQSDGLTEFISAYKAQFSREGTIVSIC